MTEYPSPPRKRLSKGLSKKLSGRKRWRLRRGVKDWLNKVLFSPNGMTEEETNGLPFL
jgi:hypothetical protein